MRLPFRITRQSPSSSEFLSRLVSAMSGGPYWRSLVKFEPRDLWVGLFWDPTNLEVAYARDFVRASYRWGINVFVCPVPMLVIRFRVECGRPRWMRGDPSDFNKGRDETNRQLSPEHQCNFNPCASPTP